MEWLKDIVLFNQGKPYIFTGLSFWIFFAIVLAAYSAVHKKLSLRNTYLFLVSIFFYYKTGGFFFAILIFSTITDFYIGKAIYKAQQQMAKKLWLALSITINLSVLAFFKYDYFLTETFNSIFNTNFEVVTHAAKWSNQLFSTHFDLDKILPPVGISFFTFQTISYSIDVYRGLLKPVKSITDFGFYVSFFPQLVAGPIVRAANFIPQMYQPYSLSQRQFGYAFFLILKGLVKKMLIGDYIAVNLIDRVFANPSSFTGFENLSALYGYSLQVYCDFSGYTDVAIGVAILMGFHLPKNFNSPYKAKNTGDFWRRWHISLSSWLKDYLYIPMGGNRSGSSFSYISLGVILLFVVFLSQNLLLVPIFISVILIAYILSRIAPGVKKHINTNINILLTMLLGGLWHGSNWTFVLWGGLNGIGVVVYKYWRRISPYEKSNHWLVNTWKIFFTFSFITFTRIWFRGESMQGTMDMLSQIGTQFSWEVLPDILVSYWKVYAIMAFGLIVHWIPEKGKQIYRNWFIRRKPYHQVLICIFTIFVIYQFVSADLQPFIYFQF